MPADFDRLLVWAAWPVCLTVCLSLAATGCQAEQTTERMRVIVTLDVPAMGDDFRDDQRRRDTRELRDRLLSGLDSSKVQLVKTLELSGQVVLEIEADALAGIENAPEVRAVAKERLLSPFTGERQ